jgi:hypothetical protein
LREFVDGDSVVGLTRRLVAVDLIDATALYAHLLASFGR